MISNVHKISINIQFYALQYLTPEETGKIQAPFMEITNNAPIARELENDLTVHRAADQECFDWVRLCLGNIKSNAKISMSLDLGDRWNRGLNHASFTELLKKLLR
jgi:hypothetical protein